MRRGLMAQASAQVHPLNASTPPLPCCAMPWVVLVVELFHFLLLVLMTAVWLICFLVEWFLEIGWTYFEI